MDNFVVFLLGLCAFLMLRNYVAYKIRIEQINLIHERNRILIADGDCEFVSWDSFHDGPSYEAVMFNLTKWTRRQVYGD